MAGVHSTKAQQSLPSLLLLTDRSDSTRLLTIIPSSLPDRHCAEMLIWLRLLHSALLGNDVCTKSCKTNQQGF